MYKTAYTFELTELRVMRLKYGEEEFMNRVADLVGNLTMNYEIQRHRAEMAEHQLRVIENDS